MYYVDSLEELLGGNSVGNLTKLIDGYLDIENYLACEGIKKAIDKYKQIQENNGI
jgi:methionine salvage enolase-phosphatase E1